MVIFNTLLSLRELKDHYSENPVGICPLYKGSIGVSKRFEISGNPVIIPAYNSLEKLNIKFSPKQAGSGDPSPENVRAISGWGSVKVTVSNGGASHDYDVTLPEIIYGGTVDAVTGVGSNEWGIVTLTSDFLATNTWTYGAAGVQTSPIIYGKIPMANDSVGDIYCTHFKRANKLPIENLEYWSNTEYFGGTRIAIRNDEWTSLEAAKAWLDAQSDAGTPVQVAYKLATPEPFEFSKISIPSLIGENTFFTNGENMDIIYKESSFWG